MHGLPKYANVCFWPKADIETESRWVFLNVRFGEKSGHSTLYTTLIGSDLAGFFIISWPELGRIGLADR